MITTVLWNLYPDIPPRKRGMFEFDTSLVISRVTLRLLRRLGEPSVVETAMRSILPHVTSLSARRELIDDVGHRDRVGHKLVSTDAAAGFEAAWRADMRAASASELSRERDLAVCLLLAKRGALPGEPVIELADDPTLTEALLRSARTETLSQSSGSRSVQRAFRYSWDLLVELCGSESVLRDRIEVLRQAKLPDTDELLALADTYLSGWRPQE